MTERYVTHMMKERSKGDEIAKCGTVVKMTKNSPPMTIWRTNVDCPACLAAMGEAPKPEAPRLKRVIPRQ